MDLSRQWMAVCFQKSHCRSSNKTAEQSLTLRVAHFDGTKVAFKELEDMEVRPEGALSFLLFFD